MQWRRARGLDAEERRGGEREAGEVDLGFSKVLFILTLENRTEPVRFGKSVLSVQNRYRTEPDFFSKFCTRFK